MHPAVFLFALLSTVGIVAFTIVKVARVFSTRRELPPADINERLEDLEQTVQGLQRELAETQERVDFAERLISAAREDKRIGG